MITMPVRSRTVHALLLLLAAQPACNVGNFLEEVFKERPPAPLERAEISSDARLDSTGAIFGSFVGEGTSRRVHLLSSDTGLIAALVRRYRPGLPRNTDVWQWLSRQGTYAIDVDPRRDVAIANQQMLAGSPDGHTRVRLSAILLNGSRCGWRGTLAELIVEPIRGGGPSLRGPVIGSLLEPAEAATSASNRSAPGEPSWRLIDTLLAATEAVMDSVLEAHLSSGYRPLGRPARGRLELNSLADFNAADVLVFQLDDGRIRYAVSIRAPRITPSGTHLVAATVMVWDSTLAWRQTVFRPTLLEERYGAVREWKNWPAVYWRRLTGLSGFAFQRDYLWMEQVDANEGTVLWTVLEPRSNTVVAAAEVDGPC